MASLRNDKWIKRMCLLKHMIEPFVDHQVDNENGEPVLSYGLSSFGYDIRLGSKFRMINQKLDKTGVIDPKHIDPCLFASYDAKVFELPPFSYVLGESFETFNIPDDIFVILLGKSTLARAGIILNVTPGEPDWSGKWTVEIFNATPCVVRLYAGEGIGQATFWRGKTPNVSYGDRGGKYQNQPGVILPLMRAQ